MSNLIKGPTCFNSVNRSTIDLFLTTNKYLFQKTNSSETGISDNHYLIATVLKTTYEKFQSELLTYRSYEHSWNDSLKSKFKSEAYTIQSGDIGSLKTAIIKSLNTVTPFKKRIVRGNSKPRITSIIRKETTTRSRLKHKTNKSGKEEDLKAYKKQRNLVLKLNRKAKENFFKSCISTNDKMKNKNFWNLCKPFFTEKGSQCDQNDALIEKKRSISEKHNVANIFNKYFVNITKALNIPEWKPHKGLTFRNLDIILDTFSSHPSVIQIKEKNNKDVFSFLHVLPWETYTAILSVYQNKSTSGTIPTKVLRSLTKEICISLTDCTNSAILNGEFPS